MKNIIQSKPPMAGYFKRSGGPLLRTLPAILALWFAQTVVSQTPSDAIMMPERNACILLNYDQASFDRYWEGTLLRENGTIATVDQNTLLPMAAISIIKDLDGYLSFPYMRTESSDPNGGYFAGSRGFQDLGIAVKYRALNETLGKGRLMALATTGFSTPLTNYLSDYRPYSLGFGAPEFSLRAISQYEWNNGLYFRGSVAHLWRGSTKAERDYYYNNGSFYTAWMDVPNAWNYEAVGGKWFFNYALRVEMAYNRLASTSGDDIRAYNAPQPTNKVEMDRIGFTAQYYIKSIKGLGIVASHNRVVDGRNVPKLSSTAIGLTYQFNYLKPNEDEANAQ